MLFMGSASKKDKKNHSLSYSLLLCYPDVSVVSGTVSCCVYGYEKPLNS